MRPVDYRATTTIHPDHPDNRMNGHYFVGASKTRFLRGQAGFADFYLRHKPSKPQGKWANIAKMHDFTGIFGPKAVFFIFPPINTCRRRLYP
jgi:hypothetical protein